MPPYFSAVRITMPVRFKRIRAKGQMASMPFEGTDWHIRDWESLKRLFELMGQHFFILHCPHMCFSYDLASKQC